MKKIALEQMKVSNLGARNSLAQLGSAVHAVTDVTGFGLIGHLSEMLGNSFLTAQVQLPSQAVLPQAQSLFDSGKKNFSRCSKPHCLDREVLGLTDENSQAALLTRKQMADSWPASIQSLKFNSLNKDLSQ
jgi:hypothetical protein